MTKTIFDNCYGKFNFEFVQKILTNYYRSISHFIDRSNFYFISIISLKIRFIEMDFVNFILSISYYMKELMSIKLLSSKFQFDVKGIY